MGTYTIQLVDTHFGRIVLDPVYSDSIANAIDLAEDTPPVSGDNSVGLYSGGGVVDQAQVLKLTGTDTNGDLVVGETQLPTVLSTVDPWRGGG
jgi:hypothetical protein